MGYVFRVKGYKLWYPDPRSPKFLISRDVTFDESIVLDVRYYFIHEIVLLGQIVVKKIDTDNNPANMMTKSFSTFKFKHCLDLIDVHSICTI